MGKRTTTRHKDDNTFRFQGQKEKERKVIVNHLGTIRNWVREEDDDSQTSFLYKAMEYWQDLNQYKEFQDILNAIGDEVKTLPQVLHRKEEIKDVLLSKIAVASKGFLEALFGLITAFVSDIRQEFGEYLPLTLRKITEVLVNTSDTEIVTPCVDSYSRLLKELKIVVIKDFGLYLRIFSRILNPKVKPFIVNCVVKCFSFVSSKVCKSNQATFCKKILKLLTLQKHAEDGLAQLLVTLSTSELVVPNCLNICELIKFNDFEGEHTHLWESLVLKFFQKLITATAKVSSKRISPCRFWCDVKDALLPHLLNDRCEYSFRLMTIMLSVDVMTKMDETGCKTTRECIKQLLGWINHNKNVWEESKSARLLLIDMIFQSSQHNMYWEHNVLLLQNILPLCDIQELQSVDDHFRPLAVYSDVSKLLSKVYEQKPEQDYCNWLSNVILGNGIGIAEPRDQNSGSVGFTGVSYPCYYHQQTGRKIQYLHQQDFSNSATVEALSSARIKSVFRGDQSNSSVEDCQRGLLVTSQFQVQNAGVQELLNDLLMRSLDNARKGNATEELLSTMHLAFEVYFRSTKPENPVILPTIADYVSMFWKLCIYSDVEPRKEFSAWCLKSLDLLLWFISKQVDRDAQQQVFLDAQLSPLEIIADLNANLSSSFKTVRCLSLSILYFLYRLDTKLKTDSREEILKFLVLALDNEVREFDVTSMGHLDNYLRIERCLRSFDTLLGENVVCGETMTWYLMSTLFQNNASIMLKVRDTVLPVLIAKLGAESYWKIIRRQFFGLNSSTFSPPLSYLPCDEDDFKTRLRKSMFSLKGYSDKSIGAEIKIDFARYNVNIWTIMKHASHAVPSEGQREILSCVYDLYEQVKSPPPFSGLREDPVAKDKLLILAPALDVLLSYCKSKLHNHERCKEMALVLLQGPKNIQAPATLILRKMSATIDNFLIKMEKIGDLSWLKTAHLKSYKGDDAFYRPEDETMFINFIVRSLQAVRSESTTSMSYIMSFLQLFSEDQALRITKLLVGSAEDWAGAERTPGLLKYAKGLLRTLSKMILEWRFAFPDVIRYLICRVCDFAELVRECRTFFNNKIGASETSEGDSEVVAKRTKAVITAGRSCVVQYFDLFSQQHIAGDLIERIFASFIWDTDDCSENILVNYASDSISWLMQLMMVWSKVSKYHPLLIKCRDQKLETTVATKLFDALESQHIKSKPRTFAIQVVNNLTVEEQPESDTEVASDVTPLDVGETLEIADTGERLGISILRVFKDRLLKVITNENFVLDKMFLLQTEAYIDFLRTCIKLSGDTGVTQKLCTNVIALAPKFRNRTSELVGIYNLVEEMMNSNPASPEIITALSQCLSWTCGKGPREALCDAVSAAMVNKNHARLIRDLNSYQTKLADTPDFEKRQKAFEKCRSIIEGCEKYKNVLFKTLCHTCFYYLNNELDIGILAAAESLLQAIGTKLAFFFDETPESQKQIRLLIDKVVIPEMKRGIRSKNEEIFNIHLKALSVFAKLCYGLHGTLNGVHSVFMPEGGKDILIEFQDLQLSSKAKAANHFQTVWKEMRNHPSVAMDFAIPMLSHHLFDVTKLKASMTNLIQCCFDGIRYCILALPHGLYFKYLENLLASVPEEEVLHKQYHRLLSIVLDAYHYVLSKKFVSRLSASGKEIAADLASTEEEQMDVEQGNEIELGFDVLLSFDESRSLMATIEKKFIPKLRKYLHLEEKASHKLAKVSLGESELVKKIPTTLAYVKLLHKLPDKVRRNHMVWVIPTLCSSLNSRLFSVRANVRATLIDVIRELGPMTFRDIVKYLKAYLTRGYQKHVRNFSLIYILKQLGSSFDENPASVPVNDILPIVEDELFGVMAEDKDVKQILAKTPEAKSQNGLQLLHYCALYVNVHGLPKLIECPIERAKSATSLQTLKTAQSWMTEISNGLAANKQLSTTELLAFLRDTEEKFAVHDNSEQNVITAVSKYLTPMVDSYLLPEVKKVNGQKAKMSVPVVSSWFVYSSLYNLLKRETFQVTPETCSVLNNFAIKITKSTNDELLEIRAPTVRSLILMFQFPLKCFNDTEFTVLMWRKYFLAVNDAVSNEDVNMYYKFLTTFCVTFPEFRMELTDFNLLVKCMHRHLQENKCTGSALVLLRHILQRSLQSEDLNNLVREVKRRICSDDSIHVQEGCRAAYVVYMKNYMKDKVEFMAELYHFFKVANFRKSLQDTHSVYQMIGALTLVIPESWISSTAVNLAMDLMLALMKSSDVETQKIVCNICFKNVFDRMGPTEAAELLKELENTVDNSEMIPYQREICLTLAKILELRKCWKSEAITIRVISILTKVLQPVLFTELLQKNPKLKHRHRDFGIYEGILACYQCVILFAPKTKLESPLGKQIWQLLEWIRMDYLDHDHDSIQNASVRCWNAVLEMTRIKDGEGRMSSFAVKVQSVDVVLDLIRKYIRLGGMLELADMRANVYSGLKVLGDISGPLPSEELHTDISKLLRSTINLEVRKAPKETKKREACFTFAEVYVRRLLSEFLPVIQSNIMILTSRERTDANMSDLSPTVVNLCASIQKILEDRLGHQQFLALFEVARSELQGKRDEFRAKKKEMRVQMNMNPIPGGITRKRSKPKKLMTNGHAKKKRKF